MIESPTKVKRAMAALVVGIVVASLDGTTVATALPLIVRDLGGLNQLPLVVSVYMLTATISLPLYGRWSDAVGRKPLLITAQLLFVLGGLLASTAASMGQLIGYRAIQGAGAGGLMVLAQALVGDMVGPRERSRYLGWIGALFATGSVAGPVVGGLIADNLGWPWVFRFVVPVGLIGVAATWRLIPHIKTGNRVTPDLAGSLLLGASLASLVLALSWGGSSYAWTSPLILGLAATFLASTVALVSVERRRIDGVLPVEFFKIEGVTAGMVVALVTGSTIFGFIVFTPLFVQLGLGETATVSGFVMLPLMASFMVGSVLVGRAISHLGRYRVFPIVGTGVIALSFLLLATMDADTHLVVTGLFLVVGGVGVSMVMQVVVLAMQTTVEPAKLGLATSMAHLSRSIGGVLGVATLGSLFSMRLVTELASTGIVQAGLDAQSIIEDPGLIASLSTDLESAVRDAASSAVTFLFALSVPLTLLALAAAFRLPDRHLAEAADA